MMKKIILVLIVSLGFLGLFNLTDAFVIISPVPEIGGINILPTGTINQQYSRTLQVSGGVTPHTWSIISGSLPSGLILESSSGTISGNPVETGLFNFTVQVEDANLETAVKDFRLTIAPESTTGLLVTRTPSGGTIINPISIRIQGVFGVDFCTDPRTTHIGLRVLGTDNKQNLTSPGRIFHAQGDVVDDTFQVSLPLGSYKGFKLDCNDGSFGAHFPSDNFTVVSPTPVITTESPLPTKTVNEPYSNTFQVTGGVSPHMWSIVSGSLPSGLILGSSTGVISGTPTNTGVFNFAVRATDSNSNTGDKNFTITIAPESPTGLLFTRTPSGSTVSNPVSFRFQGVFGVDFCTDPRTTNYEIRIIGQDNSQNLASPNRISHAQGDIVDDTFQASLSLKSYKSVKLDCQGGSFGNLFFNTVFTVVSPTPVITTESPLPTKTVNEPYSQIIKAVDGTPPYTWSISAGDLPSGLIIDSATGEISGTPTSTGGFNFTIQVSDVNSVVDIRDFTVTIAPQSPEGFVYTRAPSGDVIINPVIAQIQGVFGVDFCTDPRTEHYTVRVISQNNSQEIMSPSRIFHAQGDIADDTLQITLPIGSYKAVQLFCQGGSFGNLILESNDFDIADVPVITTQTLEDGFVEEQYFGAIQANGGILPYTWNVITGDLPSGLTLNSTTGEISGTPTVVEIADFIIQVKGSNELSSNEEFTLTIHGNTPVGQNISIGPLEGVILTFSEVTQEGQTEVISSTTGTAPPTGFRLGTPPTYYDISTTAEFISPIEICVTYDDTQFRQEKNLKLFHFESGEWVNVTTLLDTENNIICGEVSSLSEFSLLEDLDIDYIIDEVKSFNLEEDIEQGLLDKLNAAKAALEKGKKRPAINILKKAFPNFIKAQRGKKITDEQADILLKNTQEFIETISNPLTLLGIILADWWGKLLGLFFSSYN